MATGFRDHPYLESPGTVELRRFGSGTVVFRRLRGIPRVLAFSPDSEQLAIAHGSERIELWSANGQRLPIGHQNSLDIGALAPVPDGFWSTPGIGSLSFSPDGTALVVIRASDAERIATGIRGNGIQVVIVDLETGRVTDSLSNSRAVAATGNGQSVALFSDGPQFHRRIYRDWPRTQLYRVKEGHLERGPELLEVRPPLLLTPDDRLVAASKRSLQIWDFARGTRPHAQSVGRKPGFLRDLQAESDSIAMVSAALNYPFVEIRRASDGGTKRLEGSGDGKNYQRVAFSPDGKQLAAVSRNGITTVWDVESGEILQQAPVYRRTMVFAGCLLAATTIWLTLWFATGLRQRGTWQPFVDLGFTCGLLVIGLGVRVDTFPFRIHDHSWSFTLLLAALASQIAVWTSVVILGPLRWSLRAPAIASMVAIIWAVGFWIIPGGRELTFYLTGAGIALASYIALLTVAWLLGVTFRTPTQSTTVSGPQQKSQVSLVELMLWTGAVAAIVAPGRKITLQSVTQYDLWQMLQVGMLGIALASSAMLLGMRRNRIACLVAISLLAFLCAIIRPTVLALNLPWPWWSSAAFFAFGGMVLMSFALLRSHGYRLKFLLRGVERPEVPEST